MNEDNLENLKYPIGKFESPQVITNQQLKEWIDTLEEIPSIVESMVMSLSDAQLATPYRPGGWSVRQLVHHIADSHHNSYIRFKWGLTEDNPVIKPYLEKEWSKLFDAQTAPIALSLNHLKAVHAKLVYLLRGLSQEDLQRKFIHPDGNQETSLIVNVGRYAWHGSHHVAHIKNLIVRENW